MTRAELLSEGRRRLLAAGIESAALDARLLLRAALSIDDAEFARAPERVVPEGEDARFHDFIARRVKREPVDRILGEREFFGLPFRLSPETLSPRPETELMVEEALRLFPDRDASFDAIDLGVGSGAILLSILHARSNARGVGVDRSFGAARTARANAEALGIADRARFVVGDWAAAVGRRFDLVLSNPPYIVAGEIAGLAPEVGGHDPRLALDGGADGLGAYRILLAAFPSLLRPGGAALLELGAGQADAVMRLATGRGLPAARVLADLAGHGRLMIFAP